MINCTRVPGKDKGCHFIAGFVIALIVSFIVGGLIGVAVAVAAGIAKEAYDQYKYRGADFADFLATTFGGALGMFVFEAFHKILHIQALYPLNISGLPFF
jgi:VanZ family protein